MPKSKKPNVTTGIAPDSYIRYLRCRAEPGMFKGELLVHLSGFDPLERGKRIAVQLLADEREVESLARTPKHNQPADGWLRVALAVEEGGVAEVILPQPAQPVGERVLVDAKELRTTAGP
jgi:hypothetical protein